MADTKISALTSATLPLSGSELVPIVQSGTTVKTAISNIASNQPPTPYTANGVVYASSTSALATGSALVFDGTNLGIGGTQSYSGYRTLLVQGTSSSTGGVVQIQNSDSSIQAYWLNTSNLVSFGSLTSTPLAFLYGNTEQMRLTSTGLGIGTSSPSQKLSVVAGSGSSAYIEVQSTGFTSTLFGQNNAGDTYVYNGYAGNIRFFTGATERARIDSSGNLLLGKTTTADSTNGIVLGPPSAASLISVSGSSSSSSGTTYQLYSTGASAYRFFVDMGGTIHATSTSIAAISDISLKTNVRDLETGLTQVMALKPRRFDWINGDATNVAGFIAQEVEEVLPELVVESMYSQDEEGNPIHKKNLKMGDILPTMVKAIQELSTLITAQQSTIQSLTERITALEGART